MKLGLKRMTGDGLWGNVPLILQAGKEFAMKIPEIEVLIFKKSMWHSDVSDMIKMF